MVDELDAKTHKAEIVATLTPYLMALPQSKINTGSLVVYANALSALSITVIDAAMLKLMQTHKFFPAVAEIFEAAKSIKTTATGSEVPSVDEAWREVIQQVHDAFVYREPVFSTPEIKRAALNMGWTSLCYLEVGEMNTARAQFRDIYNGILNRKKEKAQNVAVLNMMPQQKVRELIGNVSRQFEVLEGGAS
jgi:hypothetical protein